MKHNTNRRRGTLPLCLLINESACTQFIEEVDSHKNITTAPLHLKVDVSSKNITYDVFIMLNYMQDIDEDNERSAEQESELRRHSVVRTDVIRKVRWDYAQPTLTLAAL